MNEQREKILELSLQQFLKHGIRKMTVQKLVEPMGLSTKTVYKFFSDKKDLLKHCLLKHYQEMAKGFDSLDKDLSYPVAGIYRLWNEAVKLDFGVNHVFYHDLNYYYPELQDEILRKVFRRFPSLLEDHINTGIQEGYFREDIDASLCLEVMELLYTTITRTGKFKNHKVPTEVIMQNTIYTYLRGLCTEKGIKELSKSH